MLGVVLKTGENNSFEARERCQELRYVILGAFAVSFHSHPERFKPLKQCPGVEWALRLVPYGAETAEDRRSQTPDHL